MSPDRIEVHTNHEGVNTPLPSFDIPRDDRGRIRWGILKEEPTRLTSYIEQETREFLQQEGMLSGALLSRRGLSGLVAAISLYYPGGFRQLKTNLGIEPGSKPNGYWTPGQILTEARDFHQSEGQITHKILKSKKRADMSSQITRAYPGGMPQLRVDLGLNLRWVPQKQRTPESLEQEAREVFQQEGTLTQKVLHKLGKSGFDQAVREYYPGGWVELKKKLSVPLPSRPNGYWTPERIEEEARLFVEQFGDISQRVLQKNHAAYIAGAIKTHYPGGIRELRKKLGLNIPTKPAGYYTLETIEEEARRFLGEHGSLTNALLAEHGMSGLGAAISKSYPGKLRALRAKLGSPYDHKPDGFWKDPENIEAEALRAIQDGIPFSQRGIYAAGRSSLSRAITLYYPGGMQALKEKLGIGGNKQEDINSDEANKQLHKLLEGEI